MKARFIGDPRDNMSGPNVLTLFGMTFPRGVWVEVTGEHEAMKLRNNSHFECDEIATDGSMIEPAERKHRNDDEKHELAAKAEALGIDVDGRWSVKRLMAEIAAKEEAGNG